MLSQWNQGPKQCDTRKNSLDINKFAADYLPVLFTDKFNPLQQHFKKIPNSHWRKQGRALNPT